MNDLFDPDKSEQEIRIEEAKRILFDEGYKIVKVNPNVTVKNVRELVDYFYGKLFNKYPDRIRLVARNLTRDMFLMKKFVEAREETLPHKTALEECRQIIDMIFDYEEEFGFTTPILDTNVLGQGSAVWITEKALYFLNRRRMEIKDEIDERKSDEISDSLSVSLEERANRMNELLKNLEENNG